MALPLSPNVRNSAIKMRQRGLSLSVISRSLSIAKSTASLWLKNLPLSEKALNRIERQKLNARNRGLKTIKSKQLRKKKKIVYSAENTISALSLTDINIQKTICALLYWGEGAKTGYRTAFINSDPQMVSTFLWLLRKSYTLDESKFRALVHLHEYHDESKIKSYWSKITNLPLNQFTKSYLKPHTSKVIRSGYMGTIRISYHDAQIAAQLKAIYNSLASRLGAW